MDDAVKYAQHAHRKDLTFRQADGIDPLPKMLDYGELDELLRNNIWDVIYSHFSEAVAYRKQYGRYAFSPNTFIVARQIGRFALGLPLDEAEKLARDHQKFIDQLKIEILFEAYDDCLEVVQLLLRSEDWHPSSRKQLKNVFEHPVSPYMIVDFPPLTIVPRGNEGEQKAFGMNWSDIRTSTFDGSKTHLRASAEALNIGDYTGAFREAIHSVESAVKVITGKPSADLGEGLRMLGKAKALHPALKDGFIKLYSYANDEKGVRHALIDGDNANVGRDEALYFFSACTAFVSYLVRKFPEKA